MASWSRRAVKGGRGAGVIAASLAGLGGAAVAGAALVAGGSHAGGTGAAAPTRLLARLDSAPTLAPRSSLPADCVPKASGPPGSSYQLGLVGTVHDGKLTAGDSTVADITASFCGVVTIVNGNPPCAATGAVAAPSDGQVFGAMSATLTLVPGMAPKVPFVAHPGRITGSFACESSTNGLAVTLDATVSGSTGLFGLSCTIGPMQIPLSGVLTGPLSGASITLRSSDFEVPAVGSSPACSGAVPANLDAIAGLPIAAGGATVTLPATAVLYRPAA